jgi:hypothetical protein
MELPHTVETPFGLANITYGRYRLRKEVISWCKANLIGRWRCHGIDDQTKVKARFKIDRPISSHVSFSHDRDAVLFKMFWCDPWD